MGRKASSNRKHGYLSAKERILGLIAEDGYRIGDKLPSINSLSALFEVGRMSVQQALALLEEEGILRNVWGSGCYVRRLPHSAVSADASKEQTGTRTHGVLPMQVAVGGRIRIRFAPYPGEIEHFPDLWKKALLEFEGENGEIEVQLVNAATKEELFGMFMRGEADVFQILLSELPVFARSGRLFQPSKAGNLELPAKDCFGTIYGCSFFEDIQWGVPLVISSNCLFFNTNHRNIIDMAMPSGGFFEFLGRLKKAGRRELGEAEAFIANDYLLHNFFSIIPGMPVSENPCMEDFYDSPGLLQFLMGFEEYYQDRDIFHSGARPGSGNAISNFIEGRSIMSLGDSVWTQAFQKAGFTAWGIASTPLGAKGFPQIDGTLNVISSFSFHPVESLDFLNFLGRANIQEMFAGAGRCVARKDACRSLGMGRLDGRSKENLLDSIESGRIIQKRDLPVDNFMIGVMSSEMVKWQSGSCSALELYMNIKRKRGFFINAMNRRKEAVSASAEGGTDAGSRMFHRSHGQAIYSYGEKAI